MNIYFKNIRIISPSQNLDKIVNLWVKDGVIGHCVESECQIDSNTEIIEGSDLVASPGLFDMHVHLREPGYEYKEDIKSGTNAASNGGFTGVVCMPNTSPDIDDVTVVEYIKSKSKDLLVDVLISGAITKKRGGELLAPMFEMADAGVVMFTDDGDPVKKSDVMRLAFDYAAPKDLLLSQHCEDTDLTKSFAMNESHLSYKLGLKGYPSVAEEITLYRDILLAEYCGNRKYHAQHISSKGAVELIRKAKLKGLRVTSEATPHHFSLNEEHLNSYDSNYKMNPPLRTNDDLDAIITGLNDGTIDCIATDHAPHALHEKHVELENAPHGIVGLETSLGLSLTNLVHKNKFTLNKLIELMSVNPRKLLGLRDIKIESGENANLTIFAPDEEWIVNKLNFKTKSLNMPYDGFVLKGKPKYTINNNQIVYCKL